MVSTRLDWTETERLRAIEAGSERLLQKMSIAAGETCVWSLHEVVWPGVTRETITEQWRSEVELALVPLSRIGQMEGKSGSLVLVGRFRSATQSRPSNALILKTRRKDGKADNLKEEWRRALLAKPHTYDRKDSFAIPVHFDDTDSDYELLWSLCLPTVRESEADAINYRSFPDAEDLRKLLGGPVGEHGPQSVSHHVTVRGPLKAHGDPVKVLERTYALLRNLHRNSAIAGSADLLCEDRPLGEEYERYLRRYGSTPGSLWGPEWTVVWAPPSERLIDGGINPTWLIERLQHQCLKMQVGLVHGDLHPGNVILREDDAPAIIDFGWSHDRGHVAKDFVLMECNLRFLTLRAQVSDTELDAFTRAFPWGCDLDGNPSEYLACRWHLVQVVRGAAQRVFRSGTDWTREYLTPLFLVAFGLLRFAPQLGNQRAAILLVERLATHLASELNLGEDVR